jgi:hypothetical protein
MAEANQDQPAEGAIIFRVGLHLGDLIVDGDDLMAMASTWPHGSKRKCRQAASWFQVTCTMPSSDG